VYESSDRWADLDKYRTVVPGHEVLTATIPPFLAAATVGIRVVRFRVSVWMVDEKRKHNERRHTTNSRRNVMLPLLFRRHRKQLCLYPRRWGWGSPSASVSRIMAGYLFRGSRLDSKVQGRCFVALLRCRHSVREQTESLQVVVVVANVAVGVDASIHLLQRSGGQLVPRCVMATTLRSVSALYCATPSICGAKRRLTPARLLPHLPLATAASTGICVPARLGCKPERKP